MQKLTISTPDGRGEAIKTDREEPWDVTLPAAEFRFYGSVTEVRVEIKRVLKREYPEYDAVTDATLLHVETVSK